MVLVTAAGAGFSPGSSGLLRQLCVDRSRKRLGLGRAGEAGRARRRRALSGQRLERAVAACCLLPVLEEILSVSYMDSICALFDCMVVILPCLVWC